MPTHPATLATTGTSPFHRSPLSPAAPWPDAETQEPPAPLASDETRPAYQLGTAGQLPTLDEFTRFELAASKAFPDLSTEVFMASKRTTTQGHTGRVYVLRAEGIGPKRLETRRCASIEEAIAHMIALVKPVRRAARAEREAAALERSQRATTQGHTGRVYVLRAEGIGPKRLETRRCASIEEAIAHMIALVAPVRRAARESREANALERNQRAA